MRYCRSYREYGAVRRQSEATNEIIRAATDIYDKTRLVGEAFEEFEKHLEQANKSIRQVNQELKTLFLKLKKCVQ